jgi:Ca2+-binding RTX toxin-like protein
LGDDKMNLGGGAGGHNLVINESTGGGTIGGAGSNNTVQGGPGNDTVWGDDDGSDYLSGGAGINKISYIGDFSPVYIDLRGTTHGGSSGQNDTIAADFDDAQGGGGNDTIIGNAHDNILVGGEFGSTIHGMGGNDTIYGGNGDDHLFGDGGIAHIYGGGGNDHIYGTPDSKLFAYGGPGRDTVTANVLGKSVSIESILQSPPQS